MRGFRGSRAASMIAAKFGRKDAFQANKPSAAGGAPGPEGGQHAAKVLPNWLKTPETLAREKAEAQAQAQATAKAKPVKAKPALAAKPEAPLAPVASAAKVRRLKPKRAAVSSKTKARPKKSAA